MVNTVANEMLSKDILLNVDMLECIRRNSAEILFASDEAVLLIDIPSQIYMISSQNIEISNILINNLPNSISIIVAHEKFSYDLLIKKFGFSKTMICHNTVYLNKLSIIQQNSTLKIESLTPAYKDIIIKNYSKADIVDINYI